MLVYRRVRPNGPQIRLICCYWRSNFGICIQIIYKWYISKLVPRDNRKAQTSINKSPTCWLIISSGPMFSGGFSLLIYCFLVQYPCLLVWIAMSSTKNCYCKPLWHALKTVDFADKTPETMVDRSAHGEWVWVKCLVPCFSHHLHIGLRSRIENTRNSINFLPIPHFWDKSISL